MKRISIFWWIDAPQYWQKKWDFERQSQHLLRSKWIIFHHLMLSILAKCILWFLVFVSENLTKRIEVFSEATAVQHRILLPFNLFQFQQENQSQCLATLFFCLKSSSICPFFFFETTGRSHQLLQRLTKGASFDQFGLTLQFHRVATGGLSLFGGFCKKFLPNFEQTCYSTNFHIKYISHICVKWVTSKYLLIGKPRDRILQY